MNKAEEVTCNGLVCFLFSKRHVSIFTKCLLENNCLEVRTCHLSRSGFPLSWALKASIPESQKLGNSLWPSFLLPTFSKAYYLGWGHMGSSLKQPF